MKGADEDVKSKVFQNSNTRLKYMLRQDMEHMGPVRMCDVQEAEQKIYKAIDAMREEVIVAIGELKTLSCKTSMGDV